MKKTDHISIKKQIEIFQHSEEWLLSKFEKRINSIYIKSKKKYRPFQYFKDTYKNQLQAFNLNLEKQFIRGNKLYDSISGLYNSRSEYYEIQNNEQLTLEFLFEDEISKIIEHQPRRTVNRCLTLLGFKNAIYKVQYYIRDEMTIQYIYDENEQSLLAYKKFDFDALIKSKKYERTKNNWRIKRNQPVYLESLNQENNKEYSPEEAKILEDLKSFSDDERYFLINFFYEKYVSKKRSNSKDNIPLTELTRLVKIIGVFDAEDIFFKHASNSTAYQKILHGLDNYDTKEAQKTIIDGAIDKLACLNFKVFSSQLKTYRRKKNLHL